LCVPDEGYYNLLTLIIPDEGYYNLLTLIIPDEGYYNLLTLDSRTIKTAEFKICGGWTSCRYDIVLILMMT
jgi:hypothetical protein